MHLQHNPRNRRASERQHVTTADILSSIARNRHQIHANYQQQTCYLTKSLGSDISHCREHRDASVLQLGLAASLEVLHATIGGEACWIPETHWVLHAELVLKGVDDHLFAKHRLLLWGLEWSGPSTMMLKVSTCCWESRAYTREYRDQATNAAQRNVP